MCLCVRARVCVCVRSKMSEGAYFQRKLERNDKKREICCPLENCISCFSWSFNSAIVAERRHCELQIYQPTKKNPTIYVTNPQRTYVFVNVCLCLFTRVCNAKPLAKPNYSRGRLFSPRLFFFLASFPLTFFFSRKKTCLLVRFCFCLKKYPPC